MTVPGAGGMRWDDTQACLIRDLDAALPKAAKRIFFFFKSNFFAFFYGGGDSYANLKELAAERKRS